MMKVIKADIQGCNPLCVFGLCLQSHLPWHFQILPLSLKLRRSAPTLGEHSAEVLSERGFSPDEIESFRKMKVI